MKRRDTLLAIESGASSTVALCEWPGARPRRAVGAGIACPEDMLVVLPGLLRRALRKNISPKALIWCMAGSSRQGRDRIPREIGAICAGIGMRPRIRIYPDIYATMAAELGDDPGIVLSAGTGFCAMAQDGKGRAWRMGGWGERLGDPGSGYAMGLAALGLTAKALDGASNRSALVGKWMRVLHLRNREQVLGWIATATKSEISALAPGVLKAARAGDIDCQEIVREAREESLRCVAALHKALPPHPRVVLAGGLFRRNPKYAAGLAREIQRLFALGPIGLAKHAKGMGALKIARGDWRVPRLQTALRIPRVNLSTESCHPRAKGMHVLDSLEIVQAIQREDSVLPLRLRGHQRALAEAVDWWVQCHRRGGRVFYVGAGSSGRIAALDAAELFPTFGLAGERCQVILAGGPEAMARASEGAEDDARSASMQMHRRGISATDLVIGITASGRTPFVLAALRAASRRGAKTVAIACNPTMPRVADLTIVAPTGAEIVSGSTRMKAGTATKMLLNTISTAAMIRLGKTYGPWMVDVQTSNSKLWVRGQRIVQNIAGVSPRRAKRLLKDARGQTKLAAAMGAGRFSPGHALQRLRRVGGNLGLLLQGKEDNGKRPSR